MMKTALLSLGALLLAGAAGGTATADDDSSLWRRLRSTAADYNARTWVRLETSDGAQAWVDSRDAGRLVPHNARPRRILVLWSEPMEHVAHVGGPVAYVIAETTFNCPRKFATRHNWFFDFDGRLMAERVPESEEVGSNDMLFEVVCNGAGVRETARKVTAAQVLIYEGPGETG